MLGGLSKRKSRYQTILDCWPSQSRPGSSKPHVPPRFWANPKGAGFSDRKGAGDVLGQVALCFRFPSFSKNRNSFMKNRTSDGMRLATLAARCSSTDKRICALGWRLCARMIFLRKLPTKIRRRRHEHPNHSPLSEGQRQAIENAFCDAIVGPLTSLG